MVQYNDRIAGRFLQATVAWGLFALMLGLYAALELQFWPANGRLPLLSFGRLHPLHAHLMIFAFAANALFAGLYYTLQRLCQTRLWSDSLAHVHFWGWQLTLLGSVVTLALGFSQGRPLAESEWPLDILFALWWSVLSGNVFMTLKSRRVPFLYVTLWFFMASLIGFNLVHIVNALAWPVSLWKSFPVFAGLADVMVQSWYVQNVKSFLLTIPFLGLMYYFVPKTTKKPLYSYRLAVLQFWSLVFLSVWTGPSRHLYSSVPEWLQSLAVICSLILLAPSWGAVINVLWTIAWDDPKIRRNPAILFFIFALLSYGLSALIEAVVGFKSINLLLQHTDWMSAQSHLASIGFIASVIFGMAYILVPKLWQEPLYSRQLGRVHFWISVMSLSLMLLALGSAGIAQGLHWFAVHESGLLLDPQFQTTLGPLKIFHSLRLVGGLLYLLGASIALYNFYQTARRGRLQDATLPIVVHPLAVPQNRWQAWQRRVWPIALGILGLLMIGSAIQLLPLTQKAVEGQPYSPLALEGREIYRREGCVSCHTQSVRKALLEELRYGPASQSAEYQQDRPALWGQRRHGPDLHRIGGKYPDLWHYQHLISPQSTTPASLMPPYPWLTQNKVDLKELAARQKALQQLGVSYGGEDPIALYQAEAQKIKESLGQAQIQIEADTEIIALIAYLQRLGIEAKQ